MSKGDDKSWDFDPSNEDEFVKNIEKALQDEIKQEKIDIDYNGGIQIIEGDAKEKQDEIVETEDRIPMQRQIEQQEVAEQTTTATDQEVNEQTAIARDNDAMGQSEESQDEFTLIEQAVHRVAENKIEEDIDKIKDIENSEETIVEDITKSLAKQEETDIKFTESASGSKESKKKMALWKRITIPIGCVVAALLLFFIFIRFTKPGQNLAIKVGAWFAAGRINYEDGSDQIEQFVEDEVEDIQAEDEVELKEILPEDVDLKEDEGIARHEDYATNILLLGEEAIDSGTARGRTDVMLIATLNTKDKTIKLTSLMRDMYVQIPGHLDNKLNSVYATGGVPLLYETIELNFNIKLDGYALVGFNDFEKIIDLLGGVDISLTQTEANWLNSTNYISNPNYRTVVSGVNHMNGNQALGYCRIRSVGTADREYDDFGRTSRHRIVLDALFHKYQSLGLWDLALLANSCLPMVTTDLDAGEIEDCLRTAVDIGLGEMEQCRIPADGTFETGIIRKMSVIVPDLTKNVEILHKFVFGTTE